MLPSLAIIIPSHNRPDLLGHCLSSVVQHAPPGAEILVVDDASPQGRASAVAARFAGVRTIRLRRQRGFARTLRPTCAASSPVAEVSGAACTGWLLAIDACDAFGLKVLI